MWFYARNELVLNALKFVDRRQFLSSRYRNLGYEDSVVQLIDGCSLSEPSLVAEMIDELRLKGSEKVLEIGTGTGYEAAVLSLCASKVYSIDSNERLVRGARKRLGSLGYGNIEVIKGDGCLGLPQEAPFDAIIVSAAAREIPQSLEDQLAIWGRIVIPVGPDPQSAKLLVGIKYPEGLLTLPSKIVSFHPLISEHQGGWTPQMLDELLGKKVAYVSQLIDEHSKSLGKSREVLLEGYAQDLKIDPYNEEETLKALAERINLPESELE